MSVMCGVQLKDRQRVKKWMLILGLNETMDQLAMADIVHWFFMCSRGHLSLRLMGKGREGRQNGCGRSRLKYEIYILTFRADC